MMDPTRRCLFPYEAKINMAVLTRSRQRPSASLTALYRLPLLTVVQRGVSIPESSQLTQADDWPKSEKGPPCHRTLPTRGRYTHASQSMAPTTIAFRYGFWIDTMGVVRLSVSTACMYVDGFPVMGVRTSLPSTNQIS